MLKIKRKSLLYKSGVEYADYCINHVEGCSHGCKFPCYAMMLKKRCGVIKDYNDWIQPKLVENALELLDFELPKLKDKIDIVHLCFTTDPFMYKQKEVADLTLKIIKRLNDDNVRCSVLTKGVYPKDLIDKEKYGANNEYGITIVSLDENFKKNFEPGSAPFIDRIKNLKYLHKKGLNTWISMEPYPTPNLVPTAAEDLLKILKKVSFVDNIIFGKLNYNVTATKFEDNEGFYERCANIVIDFCKSKNIKYHIKYGTKIVDDKETVKILINQSIRGKVKVVA